MLLLVNVKVACLGKCFSFNSIFHIRKSENWIWKKEDKVLQKWFLLKNLKVFYLTNHTFLYCLFGLKYIEKLQISFDALK